MRKKISSWHFHFPHSSRFPVKNTLLQQHEHFRIINFARSLEKRDAYIESHALVIVNRWIETSSCKNRNLVRCSWKIYVLGSCIIFTVKSIRIGSQYSIYKNQIFIMHMGSQASCTTGLCYGNGKLFSNTGPNFADSCGIFVPFHRTSTTTYQKPLKVSCKNVISIFPLWKKTSSELIIATTAPSFHQHEPHSLLKLPRIYYLLFE